MKKGVLAESSRLWRAAVPGAVRRVLALGILWGGSPLFAQPISVELKPEKTNVPIGVPFSMTLRISYPSSYRLAEGQFSLPDHPVFFIRGAQVQEPQKREAVLEQKIALQVQGFSLGEHSFPSLSIALESPSKKTFIQTPPAKIFLEPAPSAQTDSELRDIRPPHPAALWKYLLWALATLLAGLGAWLWKNRKRMAELEPCAPPKTPDQLALEELERLSSSGIWERGEFKKFYHRLTDAVRRYLASRYRLEATRLTTTDFLKRIRSLEQDPENLQLFRNFLKDCDCAKFAPENPTTALKERDLKFARAIILKTSATIP
ncbi:MAG: hypothetical protein HY402_01285 [Elusimicrobia bacterium]|nr:hypothetical protein [Elusimicrobiota bacterium]